jgi:hypothetical protein
VYLGTYITREGEFRSGIPPQRPTRMSDIDGIQRPLIDGYIVEDSSYFRSYRADGNEIRIGSLITPYGEGGCIDLAQGDEIILGIVINNLPLGPSNHNIDDYFYDNEYVQVYTGPGEAWCFIEDQLVKVDLDRVIGRSYNEVVRIFPSGVDYTTPTPKEPNTPPTFKISDLITLKLEFDPFDDIRRETNIYVAGKKFKQCKFLMLNLEKGKEYKEIKSIDDAVEKLNKGMENDHSVDGQITPEEEFWGHCSNLQAWYENNYDLRIIHSNLGKPLLEELIKHGDTKAITSWKEEIMFRIQEGGMNAIITHKKEIEKHFQKEDLILINEVIIKEINEIYKGFNLSFFHAWLLRDLYFACHPKRKRYCNTCEYYESEAGRCKSCKDGRDYKAHLTIYTKLHTLMFYDIIRRMKDKYLTKFSYRSLLTIHDCIEIYNNDKKKRERKKVVTVRWDFPPEVAAGVAEWYVTKDGTFQVGDNIPVMPPIPHLTQAQRETLIQYQIDNPGEYIPLSYAKPSEQQYETMDKIIEEIVYWEGEEGSGGHRHEATNILEESNTAGDYLATIEHAVAAMREQGFVAEEYKKYKDLINSMEMRGRVIGEEEEDD